MFLAKPCLVISVLLAMSMSDWNMYSQKQATVPRKAAEYSFRLVNGKRMTIEKLRGKAVAIEFIHTDCPHCQHNAVILNKLWKEFKGRGFEAMIVAINKDAELSVSQFIKSQGLELPVGIDSREKAFHFLQYPPEQLRPMPIIALIKRNGDIQAQYSGKDAFFQDDEKLRREI